MQELLCMLESGNISSHQHTAFIPPAIAPTVSSPFIPAIPGLSSQNLSNTIPSNTNKPSNSQLVNNGTVYQLHHNTHRLYCITRNSEIYFISKHLGMAFYGNTATFNSTCWTHKVEKTPATLEELKIVRDNDPAEQGLKKSMLIPFEAMIQLCTITKRPDIAAALTQLVQTIVYKKIFIVLERLIFYFRIL